MPRTRKPATRLAALLLAGALAPTACSGGSSPPAAQTPTQSPNPSETTTRAAPAPKPEQWPLTGETAARLPDRRAAVVKIENTASSEPQVGLGSADLVVEELVEGGLTRLAAFYYSSLPTRVGPVRSLRGTDVGIVKPAKGLLVASGGAPEPARQVIRAGIPRATEGTQGLYRVGDRPSPYNLFVNLRRLPQGKLSGPKPPAYLPWGKASALRGGKPAKQVTARFSAGSQTRWTWTGRVWRQVGGHAGKGDEFRTDNVLALRVRQRTAGYRDPAGNPVPESVLTGKGAATLFHRGKAYQGTWVKQDPGSPMRLVTAKGGRLPVPPGHTWIELIPVSGGALQFGR